MTAPRTIRHLIEDGDPDPNGAFCTCLNWKVTNEPDRNTRMAAAYKHIEEMLMAGGKADVRTDT